jgi:uncharacterized repeat protein (TIGR01451 family)
LNAANDSATVITTVNPAADLAVAQAASASQVFAGDNLTYTVFVTNRGPSTATGLLITDPLPIGAAFVSAIPSAGGSASNNAGTVFATWPSLVSNAVVSLNLTVRPNLAGSITNTASADAAVTDLVSANDSASVITTVIAAADLSVAQTASTNQVFAGNNLTYTIFVTNRGPSTATGLLITDPLPVGAAFVSAVPSAGGSASNNAGTVFATWPTLASNAVVTLNLTVRPTLAGSITNTASADAAVTDLNSANDSASVITTVIPAADLAVAQTASTNQIIAGDNVTYTIFVTNRGPSTTTGLLITDPLPAGAAFISVVPSAGGSASNNAGTVFGTWPSLASNAVVTLNITVQLALTGTITNTASASAAVTDLTSANNSASVVTTVGPAADLVITQTASADQVFAGDNLTYTVFVTNRGPSATTGLLITDPLPVGAAFISAVPSTGGSASNNAGTVLASWPSLASNGVVSLVITVQPTVAGTITNTCSTSGTSVDPTPANNSASIVTTVISAADLALAQIASTSQVFIGNTVTYTIFVTNLGPLTATGVVITDTLPANAAFISAIPSAGGSSSQNGSTVFGSWPDLPNNSVVTLTITVQPNLVGTITNTASATAAGTDPTPANNSASVTVTVSEQPAAPLLKIVQSGTDVILSWPTNAGNFRLQTCSAISANPAWVDVTTVPVVVGNQFMVTNPIGSDPGFYRLIQTSN